MTLLRNALQALISRQLDRIIVYRVLKGFIALWESQCH